MSEHSASRRGEHALAAAPGRKDAYVQSVAKGLAMSEREVRMADRGSSNSALVNGATSHYVIRGRPDRLPAVLLADRKSPLRCHTTS
jgi:hypothetical protein